MTPVHAAPPVHQLRVVVEAHDFDEAVAFYRDALGLPEQAAFQGDGDAQVVILDAGRATLELANPAQKRMIDDIEVGRQVAPPIRLAFEVDDTATTTARLVDGGATLIAAPIETPWRSLNARLTGPADLQLTVFQELLDDLGRHRLEGVDTMAGRSGADPARVVVDAGLGRFVDDVIDLAVDNAASGQLPFAAFVVRDGEVVGTGVNTTRHSGDPTAHAEIEAIRSASRKFGADLDGAIVVSSCEPCAMCQTACVAAGIQRVFYVAPKEFVPDLGGPDRSELSRMQTALQATDPYFAGHAPSDRAREPFEQFVQWQHTRDEGGR